jgi:hypothetical protein
MKCYQIFYNSCASTLAGPVTGFGVRTATEGTPQEYIALVLKDVSLRLYNSGKFTLTNPSKQLMEASVFAGAFVVVIGGAFRYFTVTIVVYRGRPMRMVGFWGG